MKILIITFILLLSVNGFSQNTYTLIAKSFYILSNGKQTKVNKPIILTYNEYYSWLFIQGEKNQSFPNEQYTRDLIGGQLHESYHSGETNTTLADHYTIQIFHQKGNNIFEIGSFITGTTFYAENAELYSEVGKVIHNPYVKNWKEVIEKRKADLEKTKMINDSIVVVKKKTKMLDSLKVLRNDSIHMVEAEKSLQSGNNFIFLDAKVKYELNKIIEQKVKLKKNEVLYWDWIIKIDKDGNIYEAHPDENYRAGHLIPSYVQEINKAFINLTVKPYLAPNGKFYPSYSKIDVTVNGIMEPSGQGRRSLFDRVLHFNTPSF